MQPCGDVVALICKVSIRIFSNLYGLRSTNIARIDCFPAYRTERVAVAFEYDQRNVEIGSEIAKITVFTLNRHTSDTSKV
jgi:hypothetical protein